MGDDETQLFTREEVVAAVASMALARFGGEMRAHRDLLARARGLTGKRDRPPNLRRLGHDIPTAERRVIERTTKDVASAVKGATEQFFAQVASRATPDDSKTTHPIAPEQLAVLVMATRGKDTTNAELAPLIEACEADATRLNYALNYLQWTFEDTSEERLGRSLLPVVVADFEELLGALVRLWLTLYPEALNVDQSQLTVGDARAMRSIEDLVRQKVDEKVGGFLKRGPDEWNRKFSRSLGIPLRSLTATWPTIVEALARRNAVIHGGGRVDQYYLSQAKIEDERPSLGTRLTCPPDYVHAVIEACECLGQVMAVELLCKLTPRSQFATEVAGNQVFLALAAERWSEALRMATTALGSRPSDYDAHELQVNRWMAQRELADDWDSARVEVEAWEPPEEAAKFVLAKAALLEDEAGALYALARCEREGPSIRFIAGWPLVVQLGRRNPRVGKFVAGAVNRATRSASLQLQGRGRGRASRSH